MAGSNAVAAPVALIALITTALAAETTVKVSYDFEAKLGEGTREYVYGGEVTGGQATAAMRGGGRRPREEDLIWTVHIEVTKPGATPQANDQRAMDISALVENALASASGQDGAGVPGLVQVAVVSFSLAKFGDDESRYSEIKLGVRLHSFLT